MHEQIIRFRPDALKNSKAHPNSRRVSRWMSPEPLGVQSRIRVWPFVVMVSLTTMVLFGRLAQLTLVEGYYQRTLADENRVIALRRAPARGILFDRNNEPLVANIPIYKRQVPGTTVAQGKFEEIAHEEAVALSRQQGERVFFDMRREYPCGKPCSTLLGYVGEIDKEELQNRSGYVPGDSLGKTGLEKYLEEMLRGQPGNELVEVDARGQLVREIGRDYPVPGKNVMLTVDVGLQRVLYEALGERPGAAIAQVPATGEVLALVSSPAYDPNNIKDYLTREDMPFFNRAIGGAYPPGSIFKVVTSVAGLEEEIIDASDTYEDTGEIVIDEYRFGNWYYLEYGRTEGEVNVVDALKRSNDIFYYRLGGALGAEKLADWARTFGFGEASGLRDFGAVAGTVPNPEWKEKTKGERWFLGNTYHMSIGQGDVLATPLQLNRMMGAVASEALLCPVHFSIDEAGRKGCMQLNLQAETLAVVRQGLQLACESGGTGVPFFDFEPRVGCKTGTAQDGSENDLPHAWFSVYAPLNQPEIVLTVLLEHGGQGSAEAAPVAREALEYWFHGDRTIDEKALFGTETDQE